MYPKADIDGNLKYKPTLTHFFIRLLQSKGLLLRCYTQNIDVLERTAGVPASHLVECHGSFSGGHCSKCGSECDPEWLKSEFFAGVIPTCTKIIKKYKTNRTKISKVESHDEDGDGDGDGDIEDPIDKGNQNIKTKISVQEEVGIEVKCNGYCKPDITFFGENLPPRFHELHEADADAADLLIVMGTSLQVAPVSSLPGLVHPLCPRLLINREPCNLSQDIGADTDNSGSEEEYSARNYGPDTGFRFGLDDNYRDIFYKGDCDAGVLHLCELLGWEEELMVIQEEFNVESAAQYAFEQDSIIRDGNEGEDEEMEKDIMADLANMDLNKTPK